MQDAQRCWRVVRCGYNQHTEQKRGMGEKALLLDYINASTTHRTPNVKQTLRFEFI